MGVSPGLTTDGRSFAALLREGRSRIAPEHFRRRFMEENWHTPAVEAAVVPPTNRAVVSGLYSYDRYTTGETEYYDRSRDPYQQVSTQVSATRKEILNGLWTRLRNCQGAECRSAEGG